jgi:hypothetical protein
MTTVALRAEALELCKKWDSLLDAILETEALIEVRQHDRKRLKECRDEWDRDDPLDEETLQKKREAQLERWSRQLESMGK